MGERESLRKPERPWRGFTQTFEFVGTSTRGLSPAGLSSITPAKGAQNPVKALERGGDVNARDLDGRTPLDATGCRMHSCRKTVHPLTPGIFADFQRDVQPSSRKASGIFHAAVFYPSVEEVQTSLDTYSVAVKAMGSGCQFPPWSTAVYQYALRVGVTTSSSTRSP